MDETVSSGNKIRCEVSFSFFTTIYVLCVVASLAGLSLKLGRIADALERAHPAEVLVPDPEGR